MLKTEHPPAQTQAAKLVLERVSKWFQTSSMHVHALDDVTLRIAEGEFVCLVGPSGCGKSTLLNIIAHLDHPDRGMVMDDGKPIDEPGPHRLMMFQEAALFPWLTVLGNGWRELTVRGEPLIAVGHEGPWFSPPPDLKACPEYGFRLCLSHTPDNIRWARANRLRLMLCGHNHGGQIRLPLFGSLFVPSLYSRRFDCGLFWEEPTLMYVSRGLGGREPLRYNCRPEATRIVLRVG